MRVQFTCLMSRRQKQNLKSFPSKFLPFNIHPCSLSNSDHQQRVAAFHSLKFEAECSSYYCGVGVPGLLRGAEERGGEAAGGEEWRLQGIETVFEGEDMAATAVEEGCATECGATT